jgi:hypothetical protein
MRLADKGWLKVGRLPKHLHRDIRLQAISEDKTLKQWVIEALEEKLKHSDMTRRFPYQLANGKSVPRIAS